MKSPITYLLLAFFPFSHSAFADLQYCNRTNIELFAAVGEYLDGDYVSTGWFRLSSDRCRIVLRKKLNRNEYWAFAINSDKNYKTRGDEDFCVIGGKAFNKLNRNDCSASNRRTEEFYTFQTYYNEDYRVDFLGSAGDTSAGIETSSTLDNDRSGGPENRVGGGSCTQSTIQMCGDPSGRVYATVTVPNLSSAQVRNHIINELNYSGFQGTPHDIQQYFLWLLETGRY